MEERVAKLEQLFASIDAKLSRLANIETQVALTAKATDVAEIKGRLAEMPKAVDFGRLDGRINQLPTTFQLITGLIATWTIGATMVFTLLRLFGK